MITSGGIEAIVLSLRAIARAGDTVAIESPTYFGILQALESLGMRVLEIPAHPRTGMDLTTFERAVKRHKIKVCVIMPNCHSPLGYVLPDELIAHCKRQVAAFKYPRRVTIVAELPKAATGKVLKKLLTG